jgi:peptidoglycan/xylan/chitin deacetylase (PgdA/CDA1 family)
VWLTLDRRHLLYAALVLLVGTLLLLQAGGNPRPTLAAAIYKGNGGRREVAFACNVVWGAPYVLPMAEVFQRAHMRATFFLGGAFANAHPEVVRALRALGMELGNHGYGHRHVAELSLAENESEIARAEAAIKAAGGVTANLYAPAYGELNRTVLLAAERQHMRVVMWTIDTIDWRAWHTPAIITERILSRLTPGAIILIHPTDRTLAALPGILAALRRRGYTAVTVSQLLR